MQMERQSLTSYGSSVHTILSNEKDTVGTRKQSFSSEEFCHYTPHWPNIHWNTEKQDTNMKIHSSNNSSIGLYGCKKSLEKIKRSFLMSSTRHVVMHPVQHDLWGAVPAGGHVAGHLIVSVPRQTKIQNLGAIEVQKKKSRVVCKIFIFVGKLMF